MRNKRLLLFFSCFLLLLSGFFIPRLKVDASTSVPIGSVKNISIDKTSVITTGKIKITAEIINHVSKDNLFVDIIYIKPITKEQYYIALKPTNRTNIYEGEFVSSKWQEAGRWTIEGISLESSNGNFTEISREAIPSFNSLDFSVSGSGSAPDILEPQLTNISLSKSELFHGETLKISAQVSDMGSGIKEAGVIIFSREKNVSQYIELFLNTITNKYEANVTLTKEDIGSWEIFSVYIIDNVQNSTKIINVDGEITSPLLKDCKFKVLEKTTYASGWNLINGNWYYYNSATSSLTTGWIAYKGDLYYLDNTGKMATGWLSIDGNWKYLDKSSGKLIYGWVSDNNKWYYLDVKNNGIRKTGWLTYGGTRYYLDNEGVMKTGFVKISNTSYYFASSGAMKTGWVLEGGKWYCFDGNGVMNTGWVKIGATWYYFYANGVMAANTTVDGYKINSSGARI